MSDDLVKRLWLHDCEGITREAADRIEELEAVVGRQHKRAETLAEGWRIADDARIELEAKLAKAVEALGRIADDCEADYPPSHGAIKHDARTTLAELTGGKDD